MVSAMQGVPKEARLHEWKDNTLGSSIDVGNWCDLNAKGKSKGRHAVGLLWEVVRGSFSVVAMRSEDRA